MSIKLTLGGLHAMMPHAPENILFAMVNDQQALLASGVLDSVNRCLYLFANIAEETGEFRDIVENIHYTPGRAVALWPQRYHSISDVYAKIGSFPGDPNFATKMMDNVYGNRMGNRPGTHDGSLFIGRGPLQLTGREEYAKIATATGLDLVNNPQLAMDPTTFDKQCAAYVNLRHLNRWADAGNFHQYVVVINGGTNGMDTRLAYLSHMRPVVNALANGTLGPDHTTRRLQEALNKLIDAKLIVDGQSGPSTRAAVKVFQEQNQTLAPDGIAGPATWAMIDALMK